MRNYTFDSSETSRPVEGKDMAVMMLLSHEITPARLARDLGIAQSTLSRWVREAVEQSPYGDVLQTLHEEVGRLRKENAALEKALRSRKGQGARAN